MKQTTFESYNERIKRVQDYIYTHLDEDISIEKLADIACLSAYHWSRIYSVTTISKFDRVAQQIVQYLF